MVVPSQILSALQTFRDAVVQRQGLHFRAAILFGSYARGDSRSDSDVDVAVISDDWAGDIYAESMSLSDLAYDILLETDVVIQPVPVRLTHWEHPELSPNPRFLANIRREGIPL